MKCYVKYTQIIIPRYIKINGTSLLYKFINTNNVRYSIINNIIYLKTEI